MTILDILYYVFGALLVLMIGFFAITAIIAYIEVNTEEKHEKECVENATPIKDNKNVKNEIKHYTDAHTNDLQDTLKKMKHGKTITIKYKEYFSGIYNTDEEMIEIRNKIMNEDFYYSISPWKVDKVEWNTNTKKYFIVIYYLTV